MPLFIAAPDLLFGRALSTHPSITAPKTRMCTHPRSLCTQPRLFVLTIKRVYNPLFCVVFFYLCLRISFQLLALPRVCLDITENNALTNTVPVTHKCTKHACSAAESTPFCLQLVRLCAAQCWVVCRSARLCGGAPVIHPLEKCHIEPERFYVIYEETKILT